jgi:hypothetical protein
MSTIIPDRIRAGHFFRVSPERGGGGPQGAVAEDVKAQDADPGQAIRCRRCLKTITLPPERISVQGAHRHTFANPQGLVFEIGCFRSAAGCAGAGRTTDEFSWFPGFKWQIALCAGCLAHLGWRYVSPGGESFHGLILDRLMEP